MYVSLLDAPGPDAVKQAGELRRVVMNPPVFLHAGLAHHQRWYDEVCAAVQSSHDSDVYGALCAQLDVAVTAAEAIAQQEALAGWKQWLLDKVEA
eukprot:172320-Pyramimonas_sp.AAC.1